MQLAHDLARLRRIGERVPQAGERPLDEAADQIGIRLDQVVGGDDAVAVVVETRFRIFDAENFLGLLEGSVGGL